MCACSPSTPTISTPTLALTTLAPTAIVENPPPCPEADFVVYRPRLQQMLLVNCVEDPSKENPNVIWGWNGKQWQRVIKGGPPGRILGGVAYDEKRNVLILYGGRPITLGKCNQETWEWDGETWTQKEVRASHSLRPCQNVSTMQPVARVFCLVGWILLKILSMKPGHGMGQEWKLLSKEGPESRGHFGFVYDPVMSRSFCMEATQTR